jgi:putative N6-adenine-specific DNA methylase
MSSFRMIAQTLFGLEDVLRNELLKLGARDIERHNRAVSFCGNLGFLYKANLCLRTAIRVLVPIDTFAMRSAEELYRGIGRIAWEEFLSPADTLAIRCTLNTPHLEHSQFAAQKAKDAIVDRFRERFKERPSVDLEDPTLRIQLHIIGDQCHVSLDSSGTSLHERGYRTDTGSAPINEVLAAGMVQLTGWDKRLALVDPMCGSGTIAIEAGLLAGNIPPGIFRKGFGFQKWNDYDEDLYGTIHDAVLGRISEEQPVIIAGERSRTIADLARTNVTNAQLDDVVEVRHTPFEELEPPPGKGILIINPPYGERMDHRGAEAEAETEEINAFYKMIGDTLKKRWAGWQAWVITSNLEAAKHIKLTPKPRIQLFNGALDCRFMKYDLYEGSRRLTPRPTPTP